MERRRIIDRNADGVVVFGDTDVPVERYFQDVLRADVTSEFIRQHPGVTREQLGAVLFLALQAFDRKSPD